ncbi:hypothetical protein PRIPAC_81088 [Pristionchus pacificus]|uniref:AMP-binding protein n=1 Tax=Pristionchus pacificus TaxID=54126 RepID=A0A2A6CKC9_PRIPA|nr:hypothetical protein PRIPAC_81088 [Pristionchus pacificus]|eukprot:PDM78674.1 AMP-binding protein [Pristionchus pacificus]
MNAWFPLEWLYWIADGLRWLCRGNTAYRATVPESASLTEQAKRVKGENNVYRCGFLEEGEGLNFDKYINKECHSLYDIFARTAQNHPTKDCLDSPESASLWIGPGSQARRQARWFITALGAISQSLTTVPLYDTLGPDTAEYIVNQCEIRVLVVDNAQKVDKMVGIARKVLTLKHIVMINEDEATAELVERARMTGISVHRLSEVIAEGHLKPAPELRPTEEDVYLISYTSGTTGQPKGVLLTHRNVMACIITFVQTCSTFVPGYFGENEVLLSFLPLSHVMEQGAHWIVIFFGGSIGYYRGNVHTLGEDMQALQPTFFPVVPRLLNRMYDGIMAKVSSANILARSLFNLARWAKKADARDGYVQDDSLWDKIVFRKIKAAVGGRVMETMRAAFGCVLAEVYGLTESAAIAFVTWPGVDAQAGHCGGPAACTTLKLKDVPEMDYYARDGRGEVLIKGPAVTRGYYKDPVKTAELFDEDGFMHTGDVGWLREDGTMKLIDRKKHIFKLAQGEYVAPEKIEAVYTRVDAVQQVYVDGDSLQRYLIAVVVPEPDVLGKWDANNNNDSKRSMEEVCADPDAAEYILAQLTACGEVKKVILEPVPFTIDNGLLTPTLKSKRPALRKKYKNEMDKVYKANALL